MCFIAPPTPSRPFAWIRLVVVLGTESYGKGTSSHGTLEELAFAKEDEKAGPFVRA